MKFNYESSLSKEESKDGLNLHALHKERTELRRALESLGVKIESSEEADIHKERLEEINQEIS